MKKCHEILTRTGDVLNVWVVTPRGKEYLEEAEVLISCKDFRKHSKLLLKKIKLKNKPFLIKTLIKIFFRKIFCPIPACKESYILGNREVNCPKVYLYQWEKIGFSLNGKSIEYR